MPYFRFDAQTPFCGEVLTEYHEVGEDELATVDELCASIANDCAEMYWDGDESQGYTEEEYHAESGCDATEITAEAYEEESGKFRS